MPFFDVTNDPIDRPSRNTSHGSMAGSFSTSTSISCFVTVAILALDFDLNFALGRLAIRALEIRLALGFLWRVFLGRQRAMQQDLTALVAHFNQLSGGQVADDRRHDAARLLRDRHRAAGPEHDQREYDAPIQRFIDMMPPSQL